jgi:hypothetical protein
MGRDLRIEGRLLLRRRRRRRRPFAKERKRGAAAQRRGSQGCTAEAAFGDGQDGNVAVSEPVDAKKDTGDQSKRNESPDTYILSTNLESYLVLSTSCIRFKRKPISPSLPFVLEGIRGGTQYQLLQCASSGEGLCLLCYVWQYSCFLNR